jgi:selenocysteine lyase/cysteine desulfurase
MAAYVARAGMRMVNEVGVENIHTWTNRLSQHCIDGALKRGLEVASPMDVENKSPVTAIRVPGDSHEVEDALKKKKVIASARADVVRIAPHFFTRLEDIDYVLDCFVDILKK